MTLGLRLSVPLEGPLRLPCHSYSASGLRFPASEKRLLFSSDSRPSPFSAKCSLSRRFQHGFLAVKQQHSRRATVVKASGDPGNSPTPGPVVGPAELKTPTGQVLSEVMRSHPHLLSFTIDEELNKLCLKRDAQEKEYASRFPDNILNLRLAELEEIERRQAIEDIMYCLIVQKFGDRDIYMTPKLITSSFPKEVIYIDPPFQPKLDSVHSPDVLEMFVCHVSQIFCSGILGRDTTIQMSNLKLGELYVTSIMYGYLLKRIDEQYQLDLTMNTLPKVKNFPNNGKKDGDCFGKAGDAKEKDCSLMDYVWYLDTETLQRYATIRSKEAGAVIEKQRQGLFCPPDIVVSCDGKFGAVHCEIVTVTYRGFITLLLEATVFGSFLWEAEEYIENKYPIAES